MDKTGLVCQILEYKVKFHSEELEERLVPRTSSMGSMQFLSFLRRSHKIISSELVGLNLVVFKEP